MPFVPDQHSVQTFPAKRTYQPIYVCRGIGRTVGNRDPTDARLFPDPYVECRSTRYALSLVLDLCRTTELTEFTVVIMEKELGLLHKAGVPNLLFCPIHGWMIGYVKVDDLPTRQFHDDEYIKDSKSNCVLHEKVTSP